MWDFIWRNCKDLSSLAIKSLCCSLVQSHFNYCSSVWSPSYNVDCAKLEKVQKIFLRAVEFKFDHSHVKNDYSWIMGKMRIVPLKCSSTYFSRLCFAWLNFNGNIDSAYLLGCLSFVLPAVNSCITRNNIFSNFEKVHNKNLSVVLAEPCCLHSCYHYHFGFSCIGNAL